MKKIIYIFIFGIYFLLFLPSCHKTTSPGTPKPDYDFSAISKEYIYFDLGSKWTYQDDSTMQKSVVEIFSSNEEIRTSAGGGTAPQYTYRAYWMWYSANNVNMQKGEGFASNFNVSESIPNSAERIYFINGEYKIAFAPFYPVGTEIDLGGKEGIFVNKNFMQSMTLNGKTYNEVYHSITKDYNQSPPDTIYYHFYFARNYGMIKYVVIGKDKTTSISLVESSLIQQ
jgi:hypothetical protein